ncbi:MAG: hypothetical protein Q9183_000399 [Haloplaca sp. 2 TL-2023]
MQEPPAEAATTLSLITPSGASIEASSTSLQPATYQALLDRGWRRYSLDGDSSGTFLYKPDCRNACCPNYTIRLDAGDFRPTRDLRSTVNAWNRYISGPDYREKAARLCPLSREEKKWRKNNFDLLTAIHETEAIRIQRPTDPKTGEEIKPAHEFQVYLEPDSYSEEKYAVFKDYQYHVHNEGPDEVSKAGFKRFLCSGMGQSERVCKGQRQKLGSYHQCYQIDGRLVAVGVLDLLPNCVSSVYLFYHRDVQDWYFGKLSSLREIALTTEGNYQYYYMGYYVHSCQKMRYKNQYHPSEMLDLETYSWSRVDAEFLARLSARHYVSMTIERKLQLPPRKLTDVDKLRMDDEGLRELREYQQQVEADTESAFASRMPGIMALDELEREIDLGRWRLKHPEYNEVHLDDLHVWNLMDIRDPSSLKHIIAELAAALGPSLVSQFILALGFG